MTSLITYAGKNTQYHDGTGFDTQQPREDDSGEEELIPLGDDKNAKESPQLTKQTKGTTRNSKKKQCQHPQKHQMSDITNLFDVQVTDVTQPPTKKRKTASMKDHTPARRSTRKPQKQIKDVCPVCDGPPFKEGEEDNWTGCDFCPRWFHKKMCESHIQQKMEVSISLTYVSLYATSFFCCWSSEPQSDRIPMQI